ncbi:anti-sigma factor antagonist [Streptomyces lucensis JCM 4490]|uniref:Anti-sigma factor antagonist n=1 Tax=Streptomyces lucensis JCM 4490 TaxID=1306176 RepID=A0A918J9D4_9ACTN|nr:STAS domain-containing protein [Streptomyces lucensis]GGW60468.1 anti-sigma factor antagonist [Streptomyces lucensis JCM 4490]
MTPLNITHRDAATGPVLHVAGELDYDQAAALRRQVEDVGLGPGQCLTLDLAGLEFCDSTGITVLLAAWQHARSAGADIVLAAVPSSLRRVFTIVGLDQVFNLEAGTDASGA